jgi:imidazoleglycerol phosphate dehydratase HisB/histidinol-phosphate/aromatic aminotransferase/cobyric acid decarboxylase-like protein
MNEFVRPDLANASPYRWQDGWEDVVPAGRRVLRFDQNTPSRPPRWYAGAAAKLARIPVQSYPDARYMPLRRAISAYTGFPPEQIVPTAGADEALILSAQLALRPGDLACAPAPRYAMFEGATRLAGGTMVEQPDGARLHWICAPHNPTGAEGAADAGDPREGLVVIDQAYVEFGGRDYSYLVQERDNTVVVRTLSKAFGVAAARVGYLLCPPNLAPLLDAIRPPGSISTHSAALAEMALADVEGMRLAVAETIDERERMADALRGVGFAVPRSFTNFLLVDVGGPNGAIAQRLIEQGIIVRTLGDLPNAIRITVQTPAENDLLLETLGAGGLRSAASAPGRAGHVERLTKETRIDADWVLDGSGRSEVTTGLGFLDHMLTALAFHSLTDLRLSCTGDLWVDEHHTVEDVGIALGQALDAALGDRSGIARYGDARAPLDEALCHATVDLGGRGFSQIHLPLKGERIGELATTLILHFFDSLSRSGRLAIHLDATGDDDHHIVEAAFKSLALALRAAVAADARRAGALPSTKGAV